MTTEKTRHKKWWKTCSWYAYQLSMIAVCCITIAIVYANKALLEIKLNETTTVLMATIGFLFAFAGINIYSIFNTNIEEEKRRLRELQSQYEDEMRFEKTQGEYARKLLVYYQTCQMIIDSHTFNSQIYEWIFDISRYIRECKSFIKELYVEKRVSSYETFKSDFWYISRGIKIQLLAFRKRIQDDKSKFFSAVTESDERNFLDVLNQEILEVESLENYDYTGINERRPLDIEKQTMKEKLEDVWMSIKKLFR